MKRKRVIRRKRVVRRKLRVPKPLSSVTPHQLKTSIHSDIYTCQYPSRSEGYFDVNWNSAFKPWFLTATYDDALYWVRVLGTQSPALQGYYELDKFLGNGKLYDSYRIDSVAFTVTVGSLNNGDSAYVALIPYNYYQGAFSTLTTNIQDAKIQPLCTVKAVQANRPTIIRKKMSIHKQFGIPKSKVISDENFSSRYGTLPNNYALMRVLIQSMNGVVFTQQPSIGIRMKVNITLYNADQAQYGDAITV